MSTFLPCISSIPAGERIGESLAKINGNFECLQIAVSHETVPDFSICIAKIEDEVIGSASVTTTVDLVNEKSYAMNVDQIRVRLLGTKSGTGNVIVTPTVFDATGTPSGTPSPANITWSGAAPNAVAFTGITLNADGGYISFDVSCDGSASITGIAISGQTSRV